MNGCIYRTEENKCKQFSVGGVLSFCYLDGTCDCQIPSNADHIRSMSDEELAIYLSELANGDCPIIGDCPDGMKEKTTCTPSECWASWLKSPVDKEGET